MGVTLDVATFRLLLRIAQAIAELRDMEIAEWPRELCNEQRAALDLHLDSYRELVRHWTPPRDRDAGARVL